MADQSKTTTPLKHDPFIAIMGRCPCLECIRKAYDRLLDEQLKRSFFYDKRI